MSVARYAVAVLVLSACGGGGAADAGADATACTLEEIALREPVENSSGLRAGDFGILFGGRGGGEYGVDVARLPDGSLLAWTITPSLADSVTRRSASEVAVIHRDGRIDPVRIGPAGHLAIEDGITAFRVWDDVDQVHLGNPQAFNFESFTIDDGTTLAESVTTPISAPSCNGVGPHTPQISNGRFLSIRGTCIIGDMRNVAERWEDHDGVLEVVAGPYTVPEADSGGINRSAFPDGRGGLFFLGIPRRLADLSNRRLTVTHWDGDGEPVESDSIGPLGTTTDFGAAARYGDGTLAAAVNHVIEGERTTFVARVNREAHILWTWQSPAGFTAGPNYPAIATVGTDDLLVVLIRPRELRTVYVMRLDPLGRPRWPEPRALPWPGLRDIELTVVVGHPTGTFHVAWFPGSLGWFDAEAGPLWEEPIPMSVSDFSRAQLIADGDEGVWFTDTGFMGGFLGHWDRNKWSLFRRWGYEGCGQRQGIVTRASPDAEARTWWSPFPFGNAP